MCEELEYSIMSICDNFMFTQKWWRVKSSTIKSLLIGLPYVLKMPVFVCFYEIA